MTPAQLSFDINCANDARFDLRPRLPGPHRDIIYPTPFPPAASGRLAFGRLTGFGMVKRSGGMTKKIEEQVVVITGASSGIGRETAMRLARRGAKVVLTAR